MSNSKWLTCGSRTLRYLGLLLLCLVTNAASGAVDAKSVAVVVYVAGDSAAALSRVAQTRAEQILGDNSITVLDQEKSKELKSGNRKLEDPGYLMTAEEFLKAAQKYQIDGIFRIYLNTSVVRASTGYFTATANANVRYVDEDAKVTAITTPVMGIKDNPPSDGLTDAAASANAVQRAIDAALEKAGLKIFDATAPRLLSLDLQEVEMAKAVGPAEYAIRLDETELKSIKLAKRFFSEEKTTCQARSPDKAAGAVGGLNSYRRGMDLSYNSEIHVADLKDGKEMAKYSTGTSRLKLGVTLLDCLFIDNWRFLAGVTGSRLYIWDTERNTAIAERTFDDTLESARLSHRRTSGGSFLVVESGGESRAYQLVVKGK